MANIDITSRPQPSAMGLLAAPFVFLGNALVALGEANAAQRAEKFHLDLSDDELAACGMNRQDQVRKAYAPYMAF